MNTSGTISSLLAIVLAAAFIGGYIANLYKLFDHMDTARTFELVVRGVGIFAAPLGALAGYF
jgi:hypothetical protein